MKNGLIKDVLENKLDGEIRELLGRNKYESDLNTLGNRNVEFETQIIERYEIVCTELY